MLPSALPLISEADYSGFQRMIAELRHVTFHEWQEDLNKAIAYRQPRNGSQQVPITPTEFDQWLKDNSQAVHLEMLYACAEAKAFEATTASTSPDAIRH